MVRDSRPRWMVPLLGAAMATCCSADNFWFPPIPTKEGRRLTIPAAQEYIGKYGLSLKAVHTHSLSLEATEGGRRLEHYRFPVDLPETPPARRLAGSSRREIVRLFLKLNSMAYGRTADPWGSDVMDPILAAGDSIYGSSIKTLEQELAAMQADLDGFWDLVEEEENVTYAEETALGMTATDAAGMGVHALEWHSADLGTVLTFRGTYSSGDETNIQMWISTWVTTVMSAKMKYQWLNVAGLPWSDIMNEDKALSSLINDAATPIFLGGSYFYASSFLTNLQTVASEHGLDAEKVALTGYWEFTKAITESVRSNLDGSTLWITGHSQGGGRAALASMYLEHKYNEKWETITFAAVGGQCFTRDLDFTTGNMLEDLDPYSTHTQITEYVHALDIYGFYDYDVGTRCTLGTTNIASSNPKKYCEYVFGHEGAELMMAGRVPGFSEELALKFRRCRYFTHYWNAIGVYVYDDNYLSENGTTDGGCEQVETLPENSDRCPNLFTTSGCGDELSCAACQVSTSSTGLFNCVWCESDQACRPSYETLITSCSSGYTSKSDTCADGVNGVPGLSVNGLLVVLLASAGLALL